MIDFVLPSLGADMDRAMLVGWRVKPGDTVETGQVIAEIETEKGVIEVECWHDGVIEELLVEPGPEKLPVGTPLARIALLEVPPTSESVEEKPSGTPGPSPKAPPTRPREPTPPIRHLAHQLGVDPADIEGTGAGGAITREDVRRAAERIVLRPPPVGHVAERAKASPRARRLATQRGIDLETVSPSGPGDMVVASDVEDLARAEPEPEDRLVAMRRAIARSMAHSKREIPHYYLGTHIDLHNALQWLEAENTKRPVAERILPAVLLLKATALAVREVPELNGHWVDEEFGLSKAIHLGVAISMREGGLVAPAIHDADQLDLPEMMKQLRDLVARARSWRLRSSEMSDPTITVTNLGDRGVETAFPVIIPPQVAMVGFGRIVDTIVALEGAAVAHPVVHATLAGDHRVTDGHRGGLFLAALDQLLQEPESL